MQNNLLTLISYAPMLRPRLFECTADRLIQMDVAIRLEDLPDEEVL